MGKAVEFEVVEPGRYKTRMLQAGDRLTLTGTNARIWAKVGTIYTNGPRLRPVEAAASPVIPTVEEVLSAEVVETPAPTPAPTAAKPAAPKKAAPRKPRKKAAKKA